MPSFHLALSRLRTDFDAAGRRVHIQGAFCQLDDLAATRSFQVISPRSLPTAAHERSAQPRRPRRRRRRTSTVRCRLIYSPVRPMESSCRRSLLN